MEKFNIELKCNKCGSNNVFISKQIDFTIDDFTTPTGDIVLICGNPECENRQVVELKYESF